MDATLDATRSPHGGHSISGEKVGSHPPRTWQKRSSKCPDCGKKAWVKIANLRFRPRYYEFAGKVVARCPCERCGTRVNLLPNGNLTD